MKSLVFLFLLLLPSMAWGQQQKTNTAISVNEIEVVIEAFRTAIINKNREAFITLFLHEGITWQSVQADETLQRLQLAQPGAVKVGIDPTKNFTTFIDGIIAREERLEEKFWNIKTETDGEIATVFFDYSFHIGERENNHGKEAWHLVKTEAGWKIASVIYSVNRKPLPIE